MAEKFAADDNNNNGDVDSLHYEVQESFPFHVQPLLAPNCSEYAVAHSNVSLKPACQMREVSFLPHIMNAMRKLRLMQVLRVQSYAWPYLNQGSDHGVVIVSAPRSGRTLSYVPPLCQMVCKSLAEQRCRRRWELKGPIAVVLAADLGRVRQLGGLCNMMLRKAKNEEWLTLVLTVPSAQTQEFFLRWLNGVGCLVATPAQFLWLCSSDLLKMPNLRFVAYDDVDLMQPEQLLQVHQQLLNLTRKQRPQLVITSQSYNHKLLKMLQEFNAHPMLLFGDILEAAVYGGVRMRMLLRKSETKHEELLRLLQQRSPHLLRTVINCHTDAEISDLVKILEAHGYRCLPYYQTAGMEVRDHVLRWMRNTRGELLLCTDDCPELNIRHAETLIHYSLSDSWSKFKLRHLSLADNLRNQFEQSLAEGSVEQSTDKDYKSDGLLSLVFLDQTNHNQMPRLVDFLQMHQRVEEPIVLLARQLRNQLESLKCNEPALCDVLLSLGHCGDTLCNQRHQLLPYDRLLPPQMPTQGDVKLQLVKVYSPTHYCVRLLEHLLPGGNWKPLPRQPALEMKLQLLQSQNCCRHWPPKAKEICTYRNEYGYERVRILRVAPIERVNLSRTDVAVEVQALDVDTRLILTTSGKLYVCPEELRNALPLAIDLRILGMVPYTGERSWHEEDGRQCADWLNAVPQPNILQASIAMSLSHTIFVHNLGVTSYAPSLQMHVRLFNMCQQLTRKKLAKKCDQAVDKLMKFLVDDQIKEQQQSAVEHPVEKHLEIQQPEKQKQITKTTAVKAPAGRLSFFAKMALQLGKENRLRLEQQKQQKELDQNALKDKETDYSVESLYNCLMNCSLLDLQEQQLSAVDCNVPEELLKQIIEPKLKTAKLPQVEQQRNKSKTTAAVVTQKALDLQCQTPPNVVRPEVVYYQTACTLELQVILPEADMQYGALLHNGRCICFWTLGTSESVTYQFTLNTHCPYQSLSHHMQGRTVYLSILKALAETYPLEFSFYKFMKPQHEKLNGLEEQRRSHVSNFEKYLLHKGYINGRSVKYSDDEHDFSSDDQSEEFIPEACPESVERPIDLSELICD
ncbi:putative ATP-dependent RNA helicase BoYb [Drosophila innubila]|uniref:putative ATP-dependent RNA helicase BoYb n=1 Tax=Drosophila innubila TaxID=198719 RepID=UPI00148E2A52|nr:putative ATP-dependent RNA helicase BoYb [Drosophila innubila]